MLGDVDCALSLECAGIGGAEGSSQADKPAPVWPWGGPRAAGGQSAAEGTHCSHTEQGKPEAAGDPARAQPQFTPSHTQLAMESLWGLSGCRRVAAG